MAYFDFFCHSILAKTQENESIKGTCYEMCPTQEKTLRERERLIHKLEVFGSTRQLVKCYSRSAADSNIAIPNILRPYHVLQKTMQHLLLSVTKRKDVTTSHMYEFIDDRLRAIRQDVTVQRLPPDQCMQLLEPMIRFYVYFGYRLSGSSLNQFDPILNRKYLLECIKWFLHCSDVLKKTNVTSKDELTSLMSSCSIDIETRKLACDSILVESLYMLCNISDINPLYRYLSLPSDLKSKPPLRLAYEITLANLHGNYVRTCRLFRNLCPLTYCAFSLYLPTIQRDALQRISVAYSNRVICVPLSALKHWLDFTNEDVVKAACIHYGLKVDEDKVFFTKATFRSDVELFKPKMDTSNIPRADLSFEEILAYKI